MTNSEITKLAAMDWGLVTPELSKDGEFVHVFNHYIESRRGIENTLSFIKGRITWCNANAYLKTEFIHTVVIDDVGQSVDNEVRDYIRNELSAYCTSVKFMSEGE